MELFGYDYKPYWGKHCKFKFITNLVCSAFYSNYEYRIFGYCERFSHIYILALGWYWLKDISILNKLFFDYFRLFWYYLLIQIQIFVFVLDIAQWWDLNQENWYSGGLEPVFSNTEKLCLASYYIQFSSNIKISLKSVFNPSLRF